ncbi:MAG TPA: HIT family protein [Candidimonas sp.]|nr:HIT family protein [Candidimonas sp.]
MTAPDACPLCQPPGTDVLWRNAHLRVVRVDDGAHPGYIRVIWQDHVAEMTDLRDGARLEIMRAVWLVEQAQRDVLHPDKINMAQFGNMVPHLHWHIIPRWRDDTHFPAAIWAPPAIRSADELESWEKRKTHIQSALPRFYSALVQALSQA